LGIFAFTSLVIRIDFGVFAASSLQVKQALEIENLGFGWLQSMVFIGIICGKKSGLTTV